MTSFEPKPEWFQNGTTVAYIKDPADKQVGGSHYKSMAIQPTDFILANNLGWCEGNAVKYICRYKQKNGVQDLEKAVHYLEILINRLKEPT